jgi:hypothetical protein
LPARTTGAWLGDWMWGLTLVTASLVMHALGLGLIGTVLAKCFGPFLPRSKRDRHPQIIFPIAIGVTSLMLAILHGLEASLWAAVYVWLGAVSGMLLFGLSTAFLLIVLQRVWPFAVSAERKG